MCFESYGLKVHGSSLLVHVEAEATCSALSILSPTAVFAWDFRSVLAIKNQ